MQFKSLQDGNLKDVLLQLLYVLIILVAVIFVFAGFLLLPESLIPYLHEPNPVYREF